MMRDFQDRLPLPRKIDLEPTINCNFKCVMCQRTYWGRKSQDMSLMQFEQVLSNFPMLEKIKIQGIGEPLLNKYLFEMIDLSKRRKVHVSTYTNGSLLHINDNAYKLIQSGIDLIRISIDGARKETFEKIRHGSNFELVIDNVLQLTKSRSKTQTEIEFWTVVTEDNIAELSMIIDLAHKLGVSTVNAQLIINTFDYKSEIGTRLLKLKPNISETNFHEYFEAAFVNAQSKKIRLVLQTSKAYSVESPCHWSFDSTFISVEGFVVPCCTIADPRVTNMGNVFEEPFSDIWNGARYQSFRKSIIDNNLLAPCKNCYSSSNQILKTALTNNINL